MILQSDFSISTLFFLFTGIDTKYLSLGMFHDILRTHFQLDFQHHELVIALRRQFGADAARNIELLKYADFVELLMPKNPEFSMYVSKRLRNEA